MTPPPNQSARRGSADASPTRTLKAAERVSDVFESARRKESLKIPGATGQNGTGTRGKSAPGSGGDALEAHGKQAVAGQLR